MARPDDTQLLAMCDEAAEIIGRIRANGAEVLRRANAGGRVADGYRTQSGLSSAGGGDGTSTPERLGLAAWSADRLDDPDAAVVAAEMAGVRGDEGPYARHATSDPVRRSANGMCASLRVALTRLREADGDRDQVVGRRATVDAVPIGSRVSTVGSCWVCGLPAHPLTAGMCSVCHRLWELAGYPDRGVFRHQRVTALAAGRLYEKVNEPGARSIARLDVDPEELVDPEPAPVVALIGARSADAAACVLCHHDPACGRAVAFLDVGLSGQVSLCDAADHSCYARWIAGERPPRA